MHSAFEGWLDTPHSPSKEALATVRHATVHGVPCPVLLGYTPVARVNPFQEMLYQRVSEVGIHVAPIPKAGKLLAYTSLVDTAEVVAVHLHWPSFVLEGARTLTQARDAVSQFTEDLASLQGGGVKLVYTVHNEVPHDARFYDEELALQQLIVDRADVTHVMSTGTVDALSSVLRLDERRLLVSPHPNYRGAYPDHVSRRTARLTLGVDPDDIVYAVLGALKEYKALDVLLEAMTVINGGDGPRRRLLIAGAPDNTTAMAALVEEALLHPDVLIAPRRIPVEHVQYYLRAADVGLVTYRRTLHSGALLLYQSFDLPVIATSTPSLDEVTGNETAECVDEISLPDMVAALRRSDRLLGSEVRSVVRASMSTFDPGPLSVQFGSRLRVALTCTP
jgi:beta-1,4-mannosyltransferase